MLKVMKYKILEKPECEKAYELVEEALRKMVILLDIADGKQQEFDELILERRRSVYWLHFAVRPADNRRKISFIINWLKFRKNAVGI